MLMFKVFKGAMHVICYFFEKLTLFSHLLSSENNGPVLLFKTTFRYSNSFLSSVATDGKGWIWIEDLKKLGLEKSRRYHCG